MKLTMQTREFKSSLAKCQYLRTSLLAAVFAWIDSMQLKNASVHAFKYRLSTDVHHRREFFSSAQGAEGDND